MDFAKYRDIPVTIRNWCQICGTPSDSPVIDMPQFPLTEIYIDHYMDEKLGFVNQGLQYCNVCGHAQLKFVVDVNLQYGDVGGYFFRTSQSITGRETTTFFLDFVNKFISNRTFSTIVELGCNDMYLLKSIKKRALKLIGIDPLLKGREAEFSEDNIIAIGDFFENVELGSNIDVVICKDALEHVSDPKEFVRKIVDKASPDTLFFFQFPILETILEDFRFDQVFHQHLNYFTLKSVIRMLDDLNCGLLGYTVNRNHWGAGLFAFQKGKKSSVFANRAWNITPADILDRFKLFKLDMELTRKRIEFARNEIIYGYGAALMLPLLNYYLDGALLKLKCVIDDDKQKSGLYYLNLPLEIVHPSSIADYRDSVLMLTAIASRINIKQILNHALSLNPKYIIYPLRTI